MKRKLWIAILAILAVIAMVTLAACGTPSNGSDNKKSFTVTLDLQNGTEPITQIVEKGGKVDFPNVEDEEYRTFKGWFTSPDATGLWTKVKEVTEDVTIYACWNLVYGKVTYNFNYNGAPKANTISTPLSQPIDEPDAPTRECWVFTGWYLEADGATAFDFSSINTSKETVLYAGWTLEDGHVHSYDAENVPVTCTTNGYDINTCRCGDTYESNIIDALGHAFSFSDTDYFGMVICENEGCLAEARKDSLNIYQDKFVYKFDSDKEAEIESRYQEMLDILGSIAQYDAAEHYYEKDSVRYNANKAFEEIYNAFYDDLIYLIEQYQYAYVFYCVDDNEANTAAYEYITDYRTEKVSDFYALYRLIHNTEYREFFFAEDEGWTEADIQAALTMSDSYGGEEYVAINDRISEIEIEFRDIADASKSTKVPALYEEFVGLNNQIAELAGYDNYIEYAYENVYNRDYSPADTKIMRDFVKDNLKQVYNTIYNGYRSTSAKSFESGSEASKIYKALMGSSIFKSKNTTDLVKGYLQTMKSSTAGNQEIDFFHHANEMFKNGNYYTGSYDGAFSYWISAEDVQTSILYFGPSSYSGAFTFVHEYGHYYNNVYNKGIGLSYDVDEIHSQANEIMFLSYLENSLDKAVLREAFDKIYYDNLFNMFAIVMLATAVDEFEYCVYTNTSPSGVPTEYNAGNYDSLFLSIMSSYGISATLNSSYWRYVVIEAPCYYISYAMSALPCVELLTIAETEGFDAAKDIYFKFFTFTDDEANVEFDEVGDKVVKIGFADTLKYAGLSSVFEQDMYTHVKDYFAETKDFSYPDAELPAAA